MLSETPQHCSGSEQERSSPIWALPRDVSILDARGLEGDHSDMSDRLPRQRD